VRPVVAQLAPVRSIARMLAILRACFQGHPTSSWRVSWRSAP